MARWMAAVSSVFPSAAAPKSRTDNALGRGAVEILGYLKSANAAQAVIDIVADTNVSLGFRCEAARSLGMLALKQGDPDGLVSLRVRAELYAVSFSGLSKPLNVLPNYVSVNESYGCVELIDWDWWAIPKGGAKVDAAYRFVAFASDPKHQADQTHYISYGPANKDAIPNVDPEILPHLPTADANMKTALVVDPQFWADNGDQLRERFNSWLTK